jgi:phosphoribosylanthranilate isomerase
MRPDRVPRVKICCIGSIDEAWTAIHAGAAALGLVSAMPSGPGVIPWESIAEIAAAVPPPIGTFLLTCSQDAEEIIEQQRRSRTSAVQICDRVERGSYRDLRRALPGIALVQVIHVADERSVAEALAVSEHVDALLLDSGNQTLPVKEVGGTGRTHDWELSRRIREQSASPVFLAGGLVPGNVLEAVRSVAPFGLDVCSGVRTGGRLDPLKLGAFFRRLSGRSEEAEAVDRGG